MITEQRSFFSDQGSGSRARLVSPRSPALEAGHGSHTLDEGEKGAARPCPAEVCTRDMSMAQGQWAFPIASLEIAEVEL